MAFQPFQNTLTTVRAVRIPSELTEEKRAAFVKRIEDTVAKQVAPAESCDAILCPTGKVREQDGILLIEHEPATPFDLRAILSADERPDIDTLWWITWSVLRGLAAVEPKRMIHGGLQLRSLLIDRVGRVKLTDFGIASAVEVICGREERRRVACDAVSDDETVERGLSGSWVLLGDDDEREDAWIAPYFAPEILAGGLRLNPTSDQFSLGVVLYQLATGVHPLGAELSAPELFGYFVPEPYPLEDERKEWAEAFERQSNEAAISADQPILAWAALVYRLLANEPGERFPNFAAAEKAAREHVPAEWPEALQVLGEALELLAQEQYDPFLTSVGPWGENPALPALWRARLSECITEVEHVKAIEAARKAIEARLNEGYAALESGQLKQARAIATEVGDSLEEADPLRERVVELEQLCDEHERHILEKADELFKANFALAHETLAREEFPEARMILTGLLDDPLTSKVHAKEAEELLTEVDSRAARYKQQRDKLDTARSEFGEGNLTAALERLDKLLAEANLTDSLRGAAETFSKEIETEKRRYEEHLAIISEVEAALERADLAAAEETLAMLPFDTQDPHIIECRSELAGTCEQLRQLLERRDAAEEQLRRGEADDALTAVRELLDEEMSPALREQLTELAERCRQVIEQIQKAQVGDALESLALAETAYQTGDVEQCRHLLSMVLSLASRLDEADQARAARLDAAATHYEEAANRFEAAERRFGQQDFDAAAAELDAIETQGLPGAVIERFSALREQIEQGREEYRQQRLRKLREWLEQVAEHLARSQIDKAETLLSRMELPPDAEPRLSERFEQLRQDTVRGRKILESFAAVDAALRAGKPEAATRLLDEMSDAAETLPVWAIERAEQLRGRVAEVEQARRARAVKEAETALKDAAKALEAADHTAAMKHLTAAQAGVPLSAELQTRHDELAAAAAELEAWLPKLASVETALRQEQLTVAYEDTVALLKEVSIPAPVEKRLRAVESASREQIAARRAALSTQLESLSSDLEQRGRRTRSFVRRIKTIDSNALATQEHKDTTTELAERYEALPRPRGVGVPIAIAAAVVVVTVGVGWYMTRGGPEPGSTGGGEHRHPAGPVVTPVVSPPAPTPVEPDTREKIAEALERLRRAYTQAVAELPADRTPPNWELYFEPDDAFAATLFARDESGQTLELAPDVTEEGIAGLELASAWRERLFPTPGPPEPEPVESVTPSEPAWPAELAAGTLSQPRAGRLRTLLSVIAPPETLVSTNPPLPVLAGIIEQVEVSERSAADSVTIRLALKGGAGAVSGEFALELLGNAWRPAEENAGKLRGLLAGVLASVRSYVSAVADDIERNYLDGKLEAAYQTYEQTRALASAFELRELFESAARLEAAMERLPPRWRNPGGYEESTQRNDDLDYPEFLTRDGRTLLLVNVPPSDRLWDDIAAANQARPVADDAAGHALSLEALKSPNERRWYVFYIEAAEPGERVERDARSVARERTGRDLPTVDQWLLAALKLRNRAEAPGFLGGLWEWCLKDTQLWVCGGCDAIHKKYLRWPDDRNELAEVWAWLNNPLVSQPRRRGDNLAGVRTIVQPGT